MTTETDASRLPQDWAEALATHGCDLEDLDTLVTDIYDKSPTTTCPQQHDLFRAFHQTSLQDVRAVILGRDPYPRPEQAHGLAFSVPKGVPIPRSLKTIYTNLENDPTLEFGRPPDGDLTAWTENESPPQHRAHRRGGQARLTCSSLETLHRPRTSADQR